MNQIQIVNHCFDAPDVITIRLNEEIIYQGPATVGTVNFDPRVGENRLSVTLDIKSPGNFYYNSNTGQLEKNSQVKIHEIIVESRYFRSLLTKCGLVEIDLKKNLNFPSKYIDHENVLTMEGSEYSIKFDYPVKKWMQIHLHGRDLDALAESNKRVKERLKS